MGTCNDCADTIERLEAERDAAVALNKQMGEVIRELQNERNQWRRRYEAALVIIRGGE